MSGRIFLDSNILVYAHDRGAGMRNERARALVERLWRERSGVLSTQVLQEFYVNVRRKAANPISPDEARDLVREYLAWEIVVNDADSLLGAFEIEERYGISFWDALIIHAANTAATQIMYSEDLSHGQLYGLVQVINPFRE